MAEASGETVCPCTPSPPATVPQGGGGAPVLRPTLAGHHRGPQRTAASSPTKRANRQDTANGASDRGHHHRPAATSGGRPRVGLPPRCRGRWLGVRSQAPFAVSWLLARLAGVDGTARRGPHRVPRERGPENVPRAACPRGELAVRAAVVVSNGPKSDPRPSLDAVRFMLAPRTRLRGSLAGFMLSLAASSSHEYRCSAAGPAAPSPWPSVHRAGSSATPSAATRRQTPRSRAP